MHLYQLKVMDALSSIFTKEAYLKLADLPSCLSGACSTGQVTPAPCLVAEPGWSRFPLPGAHGNRWKLRGCGHHQGVDGSEYCAQAMVIPPSSCPLLPTSFAGLISMVVMRGSVCPSVPEDWVRGGQKQLGAEKITPGSQVPAMVLI